MERTMSTVFVALVSAAAVAVVVSGTASKADSTNQPQKVLRHVVLFKFKETAQKKEIDRVVAEFAALPSKIDTIVDFETGTDVSVENKSKGFTHGFVVSFRDEKGRDEYLPHPDHQAFVKIVGPLLADVLVFDYITPID
jgi:hypothetical protein